MVFIGNLEFFYKFFSAENNQLFYYSDSSKEGAEEAFLHYIESDEIFKDYKSGRFLYLNAWRNISDTPIGNNHLAVCDETSLVAPDDYIPTDLFFGQGHSAVQYR